MVPSKGRPARQQRVERGAQAVDVAARVGLARVLRLLGRDVLGRSHRGPVLRQAQVHRPLGQPQVHQLGLPLAREQHVARLDVAVHHAHAARPLERVGQGTRDRERVALRQRAVQREVLAQRQALDVLRHHEGEAVALPGIQRAQDVGVVEAGQQLGFALQALDLRRVRRQVLVQHLDRHDALQAHVQRLVDGAHGAAPELLEQPVALDLVLAALGLDARAHAPRLVLGEPAALDQDALEALLDLQVLRHDALQAESLLDLRLGDVAQGLGLLREEEVVVGGSHRGPRSSTLAGSSKARRGAGRRPRSSSRSRRER